MRRIWLKSLDLENFKGCARFHLDLTEKGGSIFGDNAAGKTTLYDGLTWLLFGKDSAGRGDFDIKPLGPDGEVLDHAAVTSVEAILVEDGHSVRLRKEYYEKWSTKRGSINKTFDGNTCDYYVDGVPVKKYEFEETVAEMVEESIFRTLTSTTYFCGSMKWQERRAVLFDICRVEDDQAIMALDPRFTALALECGGKPVDQCRKRLEAERKAHNAQRETIPVRLDECKKVLEDLDGIDYDALRKERAVREEERAKLAAELLGLEHDTLLDSKRNDLAALENKMHRLKMENDAHLAKHTPTYDLAALQADIDRQLAMLKSAMLNEQREKANMRAKADIVEGCRDRWRKCKAETFQDTVCPTCGQELKGEALQKAIDRFEAEKKARLDGIIRESEIHKGVLETAVERHESAVESIVRLENIVAELKDKLEVAKTVEIHVPNLPEYDEQYEELETQAQVCSAEIKNLSSKSKSAVESIKARISVLDAEIEAISGSIAQEAVVEKTKGRRDALLADAKIAAELMEHVDSLLNLCNEFVRFKTQHIEDSVNMHFGVIRWKLFDEQVNGGVAECCEATVNGIPYNSLNNGAKVNAGLDAISALSGHYGVSVPLFIDNAESVSSFLPMDAQTVKLVVSEADKSLRVEV